MMLYQEATWRVAICWIWNEHDKCCVNYDGRVN